jgi:DNA-binding Lrp family transcriptional regulator
MEARMRCLNSSHHNRGVGYFYASLEDLADAIGLSVRQVSRLLNRPHADKFIRYKATYFYDANRGKRIRGKCLFQVALDDPSEPENEWLPSKGDAAIGHAPQRERPNGHNVLKVAILKVPPTGQNVRYNICNIYNNINIAAATANTVVGVSMAKGEQNRESEIEEVAAAVRKYFKNQISTKKILELIGNTSAGNVKSQLEWFPHRDSSWARKGPVVAFIVYCQQQLEEPDALKAKGKVENEVLRLEQIENAKKDASQEKMQSDYVARRARYKNASQYDGLFRQVIDQIEPGNSPAKSLLQSCFIGEIRRDEQIQTVIISTPNKFCREWIEKNYRNRILSVLAENYRENTLLEIVIGLIQA